VTHLRKIMLEELQRRNYAQHTTRSYIRTVEDFARHFQLLPGSLRPSPYSRIPKRIYLRGASCQRVVSRSRLAALRFFYCKTLKRAWSIADTPYPKGAHRLPAIPQPRRSRSTHSGRRHFLPIALC